MAHIDTTSFISSVVSLAAHSQLTYLFPFPKLVYVSFFFHSLIFFHISRKSSIDFRMEFWSEEIWCGGEVGSVVGYTKTPTLLDRVQP